MTSRTIDEVTSIKCRANERRESGGQSRGKEERIKKYKMLAKQEYKICIYQKKVLSLQKI